MSDTVEHLVGTLFRREAGRLLATLTRLFGVARLDLAEDVVQETLVAALAEWRFHGVPDHPAAWLTRVARNRALDLLRREAVWRRREGEATRWFDRPREEDVDGWARANGAIRDDELRMIFACCHPALSRESQVALTLRALVGLSVAEIARAFLTDERATAQRLVRAKRTLRDLGVRFAVPEADELPARLDAVLQTLYLLFNEGYNAHVGDALVRSELCREAIRLGEILVAHPAGDVPRVHALLALMQLQASRLPARVDGRGDLALLPDQDRACWDRTLIQSGFRHLDRAAAGDDVTAYHLEAGIAACHAAAPSHDATDWPAVLDGYDRLLALTGSPVVALNRAVALAMVRGPAAAVVELNRLRTDRRLRGYYLFPASLGALHTQLGDRTQAEACYREALTLTASAPERRFLEARIRALTGA